MIIQPGSNSDALSPKSKLLREAVDLDLPAQEPVLIQ